MASRNRHSPKRRQKSAGRKSRWLYVVLPLLFWGGLGVGAWCVWIDYQVRREFEALQWALPGRIYARPIELYAGAHVGPDQLVSYLQLLGYRQSAQARGPGEYTTVAADRVQLRTRGFSFWDGDEPARFIDVSFDGRRVRTLRGEYASELTLARLDPVEIAQINPDTGEDRLPLGMNDVPEHLVQALIAVEDQRFYSHYGVDPIGIARALVTNILQGEIAQGGSTLTQQLVKNLYLTRERTLRRKIEEALMALALELHFSKDEILTAYLNEVYLGQDGNRAIHGFALAAQHYFARPLNELELDELALLAGLPRGPSFYNPLRFPERASARRDTVLTRMRELDYITPAEYDTARARALQVQDSRPVSRGGYPAFMELVYRDLERDYDQEALRTEGLRIFTTLDINSQYVLEATLDKAVASVERSGAGSAAPLESAVVITDASTGEVRALAGSRKSGYTGFNRALKAVRPIGSLVKPAVYLAALESPDFHLATVLVDEPVAMELPNGDTWRPQNYDRTVEGDVYLYDALQRSLNLATVDLGMKLGVDKVAAMLGRLGYEKTVQPFPSLLLGAVDMAPLEVAQMYQTLASNGFRSPLRSVEAVTTADGQPLEYYGIGSEQAADPASVYLLEHTLQGVFERGTARNVASRFGGNLPLAGKTGTTNDLRDSWFAGFGEDLVGVVWLGYDDNRETGLTGATGALRVWTDIMTQLDIQPRQTRAPQGIQWEQVPAQAVSFAQRRDCSRTVSLPFRAERMPDVDWSCEVTDSFFDRLLNRSGTQSQ